MKDLAQETARATEDISRRIDQIQGETGHAILAITEVGSVIAQIHDFQSSIAGAVEEQTATAADMSRSVEEMSGGTASISQTINSVAEAAHTTSTYPRSSDHSRKAQPGTSSGS